MTSESLLPIQIKANQDGFILVPAREPSFQTIMNYLEERLQESHDFFHRSEMILDLRTRPLSTDQIATLSKMLADKAAVKLVAVKLANNLNFILGTRSMPAMESKRKSATEAVADSPMIIRTTCRSGTRIEAAADCVILGDVNPGAEVIAGGDIIVFGRLRGVAHAGAHGDAAATIWALSIEPNQLRIADLVAVPPRDNKPVPKRYEVARIKEGMIQVMTS